MKGQYFSFIFILLFVYSTKSNAHSKPFEISVGSTKTDSIIAPVFDNESLNAAVFDYTHNLDNYYLNVTKGKPDAISILNTHLRKANERILKEADKLSDEELDQLQSYLEQYGVLTQQKADQYFKGEIATLELELQKSKEEAAKLEKEAAATIEEEAK